MFRAPVAGNPPSLRGWREPKGDKRESDALRLMPRGRNAWLRWLQSDTKR